MHDTTIITGSELRVGDTICDVDNDPIWEVEHIEVEGVADGSEWVYAVGLFIDNGADYREPFRLDEEIIIVSRDDTSELSDLLAFRERVRELLHAKPDVTDALLLSMVSDDHAEYATNRGCEGCG